MNLFELFVKIGVDDQASGNISKITQSLGNGLKTAAKVGAAAVGAASAAVVALGKIGLEYNSQMEQYTTNFTTMLGSQEAAVQKVEELKKFAASTPLSMDDLAKGTQTLLAFGVESENSTGILRQLGDIALGDADKMQRLSTAFGKATAAGKLSGDTVQQMIDAGWNPLIQISQAAGETMEETQKRMSDGAISVEELQAAMEAVTTGTGQFAGGMEAASHTTQGLISTLKDNANALVGEVFMPISDGLLGSVLPGAIEAVSSLTTAFRENGISGMIEAAGGIIGSAIGEFTNALPQFVGTASEIVKSLVNGINDNIPQITEGAVTTVNTLANGILGMLPEIIKLGLDIIVSLANGIAESLPELIPTIVDVVLQIVETLIDNVDMLIDASIEIIIALADGLINALPTLIEKVPEIIVKLIEAFTTNAPKMLTAAMTLIVTLAKGLITSIPQLIKSIPKIVTSIVNGFKSFMYKIKDIVKNIVKGVWEGIQSAASWIKEKVTGFFSGIVGSVKDFLGIASPSKLFRDHIGRNIGLGVAEGLEDSKDEAVKAANKLAESVYSKSVEWLDRQTKYQKFTLSEQLQVWDTIQSQFVAGSKQYLDAEEEIYDLRTKIREGFITKASEIEKSIQSLEAEYQDALAKRAGEIFKSYGLFDAVEKQAMASGNTLVNNLRDQISNIETFYDGLEELAERGAGTELVDEIRAMGPDALGELAALLSMSDEKLSEYAALYKEKQDLANKFAIEELEQLRQDTDEKIAANLADIERLYEESAPVVGLAFSDGLASGIMEGMSNVINSAVNVAQSAVEAVKDTLGIHSPSRVFAKIGKNMALGLGEGWEDEYGDIKRGIQNDFNFKTGTVDFASSGFGVSSAGIINSTASNRYSNSNFPSSIELRLSSSDGQMFGRWLVPFVRSENRSNPEVVSDI